MGDKVTLTRPDGSQLNADESDVEQYKALGYKPETPQAAYSRNIEAGREEYFTTPGQRTIAGLEGFLNGVSLGGYTALAGGDDEQDRARYNPGTRLAGELVGAVAPSLIPGGAEAEGASIASRIAGATPVGLLEKGAEAAAEATTATKTGHALVKGAIEGAAFGGAASATDAKLSGDPVTAEAIVAGMGWGALWGGGLGYVAGKLGVAGEKAAAEAAAAKAPVEASAASAIQPEAWNQFRLAVDDVRKTATKTIDEAAEKVAASADAQDTITAHVLSYADQLEEAQGALFNHIDVKGGWPKRGARGFRKELISNQRAIGKAINDRDFEAFEKLTQRHHNIMKALGDLTKQAVPELEPFVLKSALDGSKALDSLKSLSAVTKSLDGFPFTPEGFSRMTPSKMEKVAAAAETFIKDAPEELAGQKDAMAKAIDDLVATTGLDASTLSPSQKLRQLHEVLRTAKTRGAEGAASKLAQQGFGAHTAKYIGGRLGSQAAKDMGGGFIARGVGHEAGRNLVGGLLSIAGGVKGMLAGAAAKYATSPAAVKALKFAGPAIDPLKVRLDGSLEQQKLPRKKLMEQRMKEIRDAAPTVKDTLFRAVEPLVGQHTELASAMSQVAAAQFAALVTRMPRDPGTAINRMQSLWSPDPISTEKFARAYEVFQNPVGVAMRWLQNPKAITPEGAAMMREHIPELWTELRVNMLDRISQPGVLDKMTYSEQMGLGQLLGLRIHSSQDPQFIQAQQAMFQQRNEPLPARPSAANNSNNPSGTSRDMTPAQRITEH